MKPLSDNEMRALQLIRSGTNSLMPTGEALLNAHVPTLLRKGYIKYGQTKKRAYVLTTLGYHVTDVSRG